MVNIATCRRAAAAWQALMILLLTYHQRGVGTSQFEVGVPIHIVLCKKVPAEVEAKYYRVTAAPASTSSMWT